MNKINYDAEMCKIAESERNNGNSEKPKLLLHACCAPCSSACLERLIDYFKVSVLFYNPNIEDEEYLKRKAELIRLINETGWAEVFDCDHETGEFYSAVKGLENCEEGGKRCEKCFALRLDKTARLAKQEGFDYFATTLTVSPLKNAEIINAIGYGLSDKYGVKWLPTDFKKRNGYLRSIEISKKYGLYRQNYCGCIFSQAKSLN